MQESREFTKRYILFFIIILFSVWLYRYFVLYNFPYDLYLDEAYYFNWAKHLDFGYYSKPPMLSLLIAFTTSIFGDTLLGIKIGSLIVYPITTFVIYLIANELFDRRIALYSALVFFTLPSIWLSSLIISTDVVLLLFWALGMLFFIRALKYEKSLDWILAGISSGLGLLSKYNFIFFLVSVFLILLFIPKYRKHFFSKNLYMSIILAFIVFLPNLYWNYQNDFVSFTHTGEISKVSETLLHPNKFIEFFGAQFLVFGPILFFYFWVIVFKREFLKDDRFKILFYFSIVMLGFIMILSFLSRSFANWAAPTYVAGTILVVAYLVENRKEKLLKYSIIIHTLLALVFYNYHYISDAVGFELNRHNDPYKRVMGWSDIASKVGEIEKKYPNHKLLVSNRGKVALFDYYLKTKTYIFNPSHVKQNQYHLTRDLNTLRGEDFLFINESEDGIKEYFESVKKVDVVNVKVYNDFNRTFNIYEAKDFKGY